MKKGWGKNTLLTLAAIVAFALLLLFNVITLGQSAETEVDDGNITEYTFDSGSTITGTMVYLEDEGWTTGPVATDKDVVDCDYASFVLVHGGHSVSCFADLAHMKDWLKDRKIKSISGVFERRNKTVTKVTRDEWYQTKKTLIQWDIVEEEDGRPNVPGDN